MKKDGIRIGTRGSALALWQANHVSALLRAANPWLAVEIVTIKTTGDKILDSPLAQVGGKGLFVKEIEEALLAGEVDLAVHSLKDVPAFFPEGLGLAAVLDREDPRDALLARNAASLDDLPKGARVGTSSLRRQAQLLNLRPDLEITTLRGNVDTRVRKLESGDYDAIVLAAAGVKRMGLAGRVSAFLDVETILPAVGQGAIGIETRANDPETNRLVSSLDDPGTRTAVSAERAFLRRLEGGCQVPIAAHAIVSGGSLAISGLVASLDGRTAIRDQVSGSADQAEALGVSLAERILERGGGEILDAIYGGASSAYGVGPLTGMRGMDKHTTPDFSSIALVTVDTQRDTLDGQPFEISGTSAVLPRMGRVLRAFRRAGKPIIHVVRLYTDEISRVDRCRRSLVEKGAVPLRSGAPGCELARELLPDPDARLDADLLLAGGIQRLGPNEIVVYKPRWGAFFGTPLESHLRDLGVSTLAFMGCNFPNCPRTSIYEASERDFRIVLVEDAVSGLYERGEEEMRRIGIALLTAREVEEGIMSAYGIGKGWGVSDWA